MRSGSLRAGNALTPTQLRIGGGTRIRRPRRLAAIAFPLARWLAFVRDSRGAASIELALGAVALLAVSALCFDLYSRIKADTAAARMAATMADYVSRDTAPNGDEMTALGRYLYGHELGVPADVVYVVSALHQPPGDPLPAITVLWSDASIRVGDSTATASIAADCPQFGAEGGAADLPDGFAMSPGEVIVIAEVCARLTREGSLTGRFVAGDVYRLHALPARESDAIPAKPVHTAWNGGSTFAHREPEPLDGAGPGSSPAQRHRAEAALT